jgi:hypothetical protein
VLVARIVCLWFAAAVLAAPCPSASAQDSQPATRKPVDTPDPQIAAALARIDRARIESDVRRLASFGTRHALSPWADEARGAGAAARWIKTELEAAAAGSAGRMSVRLHEFDPRSLKGAARFLPEWWKEGKLRNVVAELRGSEPDRVLIVGAHYDSRAGERFDVSADAPGANDDASGTAVVLELARCLAKVETRASIWFVAFTAEEMALWGSQALARDCDDQGIAVEAMLNNDIVGGARNREPGIERDVLRLFSEGRPQAGADAHPRVAEWARGESESDSPSREWARFVRRSAALYVPEVQVRLIFRLDRFLRGGDHRSFNQLGFAAARLTELAENYDQQHQNVREEGGVRYGDLPEHVDYDYAAKVARVNAAALLAAARAPAPPRGVAIDVAALMTQTRLTWKKAPDEGIAYRVLLRRTTDPEWTIAREVGGAAEATLPESKDEWLFAVAAVDQHGRCGIAAFARPGGRAR